MGMGAYPSPPQALIEYEFSEIVEKNQMSVPNAQTSVFQREQEQCSDQTVRVSQDIGSPSDSLVNYWSDAIPSIGAPRRIINGIPYRLCVVCHRRNHVARFCH